MLTATKSRALWFADACQVTPGSRIVHGGRVYLVLAVKRCGLGWPYYLIANDGLTWVSWQRCAIFAD